MGDLEDIGQKIKGKAQQMKGEIEQNMGNQTHGTWDKIKGTANKKIADFKINSKKDYQ
jgi:uncharacterized protein YjbJ (UPF0337 family)